jgi:hypothetical protein
MVQLPLEGDTGPTPDWPLLEGTQAELHRWNELWKLPAAVMWRQSRLQLVVARYVRDCLLVEEGAKGAGALLKSEVRQQEDRLGLNPVSMMRLRWEVVQDEVSIARDDAVRKPGARRLTAVDPQAASG